MQHVFRAFAGPSKGRKKDPWRFSTRKGWWNGSSFFCQGTRTGVPLTYVYPWGTYCVLYGFLGIRTHKYPNYWLALSREWGKVHPHHKHVWFHFPHSLLFGPPKLYHYPPKRIPVSHVSNWGWWVISVGFYWGESHIDNLGLLNWTRTMDRLVSHSTAICVLWPAPSGRGPIVLTKSTWEALKEPHVKARSLALHVRGSFLNIWLYTFVFLFPHWKKSKSSRLFSRTSGS